MPIFTPIFALYTAVFFLMLSNSIMALALPWMVLQKTDDILVTGTVGAIALTAVLVGALLARLLVQKMGARSLIILSFLLNLIGTAGIIFCFAQDILPIPLLIIFVIIDRLLDSISDVAMESRMPELARFSKKPLTEINAMKEGLFNGGSIFGAASAGFLLTIIDPLWVFALAGMMTIIAFLSFLRLFTLYRAQSSASESPSVLTSTRWVFSQSHLRGYMIIMLVVMASIASLDDVLMPAFINSTSGNPADIGFILASYSLTGIVTAFLYAKYHALLPENLVSKTGIVGVALFFAGLIIFENPVYVMIITAITGILSGPLWPLIQSRLMEDTPKTMRLGMLTMVNILFVGISPLIVIIHAVIIDASSVKALSIGIVMLVLATLFLKTSRS